MSNATEERLIRSVDFDGDEREAAEARANRNCHALARYLEANFPRRNGYRVKRSTASVGNTLTRIRKGSCEITVETNFGLNTAFEAGKAYNYYCHYVVAAHRNRALDSVVFFNDQIMWGSRAFYGFMIGLPIVFYFIYLAAGGYLYPSLYFGSLALFVGASVLTRLLYKQIKAAVLKRSSTQDMDREWGELRAWIDEQFVAEKDFSFDQSRAGIPYERELF